MLWDALPAATPSILELRVVCHRVGAMRRGLFASLAAAAAPLLQSPSELSAHEAVAQAATLRSVLRVLASQLEAAAESLRLLAHEPALFRPEPPPQQQQRRAQPTDGYRAALFRMHSRLRSAAARAAVAQHRAVEAAEDAARSQAE